MQYTFCLIHLISNLTILLLYRGPQCFNYKIDNCIEADKLCFYCPILNKNEVHEYLTSFNKYMCFLFVFR